MMKAETGTKKDLAWLFGVTTKRIEQLTADGVISPLEPVEKVARYDLWNTVKTYVKFLSDKANGREKKKKDASLETQRLEGDARIKQAKAELEELKLKELRGELHKAEDIEAITTDSALYLRSMIMALPGQLAVDLSKMDNPAEIADRIKTAVYSILENMASYEYDPEKYAERVREREGWKEIDEDE